MAGVPEWLKAISGGLLSTLEKANLPDKNTPRRVADQLGQWAAHLTRSAVSQWTPYLLRGEQCSFCDEDALGSCIGCSDPTCLAHAHVSYRGEMICDECVGKVLGRSKKRSRTDIAFEYLNLTSGATLEEITAMYRIRSKQIHPDRGGETAEMTKLNEHYQVLKSHKARRAS